MSPTLRILQLFPAILLSAGCATSVSQESTPQANRETASISLSIDEVTPVASTTLSGSASAQEVLSRPLTGFMTRKDVQLYYTQLVAERNLPAEPVADLLSDAQYQATAIRLMTPGGGRIVRDWPTYRGRFVEPIRIERGIAFMQQYRSQLQAAEQRYGVPASIIAAIIGVETLYGSYMGNFRVLDAITTLAFNYPEHPRREERVTLFRNQLSDLIELHINGKLDASKQLGSFAGAIGIPQFMPTSIKEYAVSTSTGQPVDLEYNVEDAILSVANFLRQHGWVPGAPVFAPVQLPNDAARLVEGGLSPTTNWSQLLKEGARLRAGASSQSWSNLPLGVIDLPTARTGRVEYRVGTPNFFALTHYNRSYFYATSVAELATAIDQ